MGNTFKPTRPDGRSFRAVVVDVVKDREYGTVIQYSELGDALGLNPKRERALIQVHVRTALRTLLKLHKRGLQSVSNVGYRIIEPREHVLVANGHQTKAKRQLQRAINFYEGADLSKMTDSERQLHLGQQMLARAIYASHQHLDERLRKVEELLQGTATVNV